MGKTALVLSGGGSRGAYEIGVWKALCQLGVKIDMVMGTSVGAINGAMILQGDLELSEKLWLQLETDMVFDVKTAGSATEDALAYAKEIIKHGGADPSGLQSLLSQYIHEEQIRKSCMEYGLVTTEFPSMEGHYLYIEDIPQGQLLDYILASASCFPAVRRCVIGEKQFIDGGYRDNLPAEMAMKKGATHIIAVDLQAAGFVRKDTLERAREKSKEFHLLRSPLDLGNFLVFDTDNASRAIRLGYLDTMREWGKYDGIRYTFEKGIFNKHQLAGADAAAYILRLDPCCIYDRNSLKEAVTERIKNLPDGLEDFREFLHDSELRPQVLLYIAKDLKENKEKSLFLQPTAFKLLSDEIQAANYLIKEGVL